LESCRSSFIPTWKIGIFRWLFASQGRTKREMAGRTVYMGTQSKRENITYLMKGGGSGGERKERSDLTRGATGLH